MALTNHKIRVLKSICSILLFIFVISAPVFAGEMIVKKITLGRFAVENNKIVLSKSDPYWPAINRHNLAIDDKGYIYVLNIVNREINVFDDRGKISKKIPLPIKPFKKELDDYGHLEVSNDGKKIFVNIPATKGFAHERDFVPSSGLAVNDKGEIIRQTGFPEVDIRLCNGTYVFLQGRYIYDNEFRLWKERFTGFTDSEGKYDINKQALLKTTRDGKKIWEKKFDGYFFIEGIDKNNYIFISGRLKKGDPNSLYKLGAKGNIIAQAPLPTPFPFLTQAERDEWDARPSEEFLSFFKVPCNGDAYLIYQLGELPTLTFQRWLKGGEYFIYKFETKK
jgi:hypothetical protein